MGMKICVVTGSRADAGLLAWPTKILSEDGHFEVDVLSIRDGIPAHYALAETRFIAKRPDCVLLLGDRFEILAAATAAHLQRVPIAHIAGGDVSEGSYDDAMRDCVSRMAAIHFATSPSSAARLVGMGCRNVYDVGSTGIDYIMHGDWKRERPIEEPYVVVSYQAETIDDTVNLQAVTEAVAGRKAVWIRPNPDRGSERIPQGESFSHPEFLNLLYHCDCFIGNSSAILYEAPFLKPGGIPCHMIGKRQRGRVIPWGNGRASERIRDVLRLTVL